MFNNTAAQKGYSVELHVEADSRLADQAFVIEGANVVLPDRVARVSVRVEAGKITDIDGARQGARVINGAGLTLAPALIDIHGDAFERQLMPRQGVFFPTESALLETDRQLASNGIATAYHALTLSWEPGLRSVTQGRAIVEALAALGPRLRVDNRVQLRWETYCFDALDLISDALAGPKTPALAFNDHTSMALLDASVPLQIRPFDHDPAFPVTDLTAPRFLDKMKPRAKRSNLSVEDYVALLQDVWARRSEVPGVMAQVAQTAAQHGAPMLSHDDSQVETRSYYRALGAGISEFPMNVTVAQAARDAGDFIVFGAPNALRGGSHIGSPGSADMISAGLCDILASDYYYPALLLAIARLQKDLGWGLAQLWPLVAQNPARALGLTDRGVIAQGQRADLVLIEWPEGGTPVARMTWAAGALAYAALPNGGLA